VNQSEFLRDAPAGWDPSRWAEEIQFHRLVDAVVDCAIFLIDPRGIVKTWNPGAERLKGYRASEVIGRHFSILYPPEDQDTPAHALQVAAEEGRFETENWRLRKNGSRFWAGIVLTSIRDREGRLVGFAKVTRDLTERHIAERTLREQVARLTATIDCVGAGVIVGDREGTPTLQNASMQDMLGLASPAQSLDELLNRRRLFLPDGVTPIGREASAMAAALRGEARDDVEVVMLGPTEGEKRHLRINARPLPGLEGEIAGGVIVAHDVTAARRAHDEVSRQRAMLESILRGVAEIILVSDRDGNVLMSNPAFDRLIGVPLPPGTPVTEQVRHYEYFTADGSRRFAPDDWPAALAFRGDRVEDQKFLLRSLATGQDTLLSTSVRILRAPDEKPFGALLIARDVSAHKGAGGKMVDKARLEQGELLVSILECVTERVIVYDRDGRIVLTNPAAERLLDPVVPLSAPLEARQARYDAFALAADRRLELDELPLGRAMAGLESDDLELLVKSHSCPDGIPMSVSGRPLLDRSGQVAGAVVTMRDIAARQLAERERDELLRDVRRSDDELAQFAYVASHDLRAPLRAISSLAEWLEEDLRTHFNADTFEQMRMLRGRVNRMDVLLRDLLDYSRIGRIDAEVTTVNVHDLVNEIAELVGPPPGFHITRSIDLGPIQTAALSLKRALLNLVSNAIKHHDRKEGEVRIGALDDGAFLVFVVSDDGPGIPRRFQERIFEMFQKLQPRDKVEGSGMGLALVKKLADISGGDVSVASDGRGTTFRLRWPRVWPARRLPAH